MSVQRHLRVLDSATAQGLLASAIKVAFATGDLKSVNQHFGAAQAFAIYGIDPGRSRLIEAAQFDQTKMGSNEGKLTGKIAALEGCIAVYANAIGASAISQLRARGIQPIKVHTGARIDKLVTELQDELRQGPSTWLARAIERTKPQHPDRFAVMEAEGWDES